MTILLGRKGDREPMTCASCGRHAGPFGHLPKFGSDIAWLCTGPDCLTTTMEVYVMPPKKLDIYEERAIRAAGEAAFDQIAETIFGAMWGQGVRNLEELDAATFKRVADSAASGPEFQRAMEAFLNSYAASIREQISSGAPPF